MVNFFLELIIILIIVIITIFLKSRQFNANKNINICINKNEHLNYELTSIISVDDFQLVQIEDEMKIMNTGVDLCDDRYICDFDIVDYVVY